jgi:hypothetical protein
VTIDRFAGFLACISILFHTMANAKRPQRVPGEK